jgi:hypothetical protein
MIGDFRLAGGTAIVVVVMFGDAASRCSLLGASATGALVAYSKDTG